MRHALLTLVILMLCTGTAWSDTVYIPGGGDSTGGIQSAIDNASGARTIVLQTGIHTISAQINVNKPDITIQGEGPGNTTVQVSGTGYRFSITAVRAVVEDLTLEKTDKTGLQNIIYVGAADATIRNNVIYGQYEMGDPQVSRALEVSAVTGLTVSGNTIHSLRQPAYFNPAAGTVSGNDVYNTRGWVVTSNASIDFDSNSWGDGSLPNYYDVAIINDSPPGANNYPDIVAMSAANEGAIIENQWHSPAILSIVHVDAGASGPGNGSIMEPYTTITPSIPRVAPGGTVTVAAGTYTESVTVNKSVHLVGAGSSNTTWQGTAITSRSILINRNSSAPADVHVEITGFSFETENNQTIRASWSTSHAEALTLDIHGNRFAHVNTRNPGADFAMYINGANQTPRGTQGALRVYENEFDVVTGGVLFEYCRAVDVLDNTFNVTYEGVIFNYYGNNGDLGEQLVKGNVFTHVPVSWALAMNNWHGSGTYTVLPSVVTNNVVTDTGFAYAILYGMEASQTTSHDFVIHDNAILSGTIPVWGDYASQVLLNASGNWWGSSASPAARINTAGTADFTPWLASGVDTSTDPGFQGDFSELWVSAASPQTGSEGYIEEALGIVTGSTVNVLPGVYEEQVVITMDDLALIGAGSGDDPAFSTIIRSPVSLGYSFQTGTLNNYPVIGVDGCTGVSIENLRVDGYGRGNSNYRFSGIAFWNAGGDVTDCAVVNIQDTPFSGSQHGVGIYAYNTTSGPYTVNITGTDVADYQKTGVALSGTGLTANLDGCVVTGEGATPITAQNGIQIGFGAGGEISACEVAGNIYTGSGWSSAGILLYQGSTVDIGGSVVTDNYVGVDFNDTDGSFVGGRVENVDPESWDAIYIRNSQARDQGDDQDRLAPASPLTEEAVPGGRGRNTQTCELTGAQFVGHGKADTWGVYVRDSVGSTTVDMTNCVVGGWGYGVITNETGGTVAMTANYNTIAANTYGFYSNTALPQNALSNWWGDATGPYHDDTNLGGLGNEVSDNVDFDPWIGKSGGGNIVCIPDPLEISLADDIGGGVYQNGLVLHYLGGGTGPMYSYSIDVEWDNTVVSAATTSFTRPSAGPFASAPLFQVSNQGSDGAGLYKVRIDAALGGAHPGTIGPDDLFAAVFTAVGTPDYATSPVDLTVRYVRDNQNQNLAGFVGEDGLVIVDLVGPSITDVLLTNDTLAHTNDYVKDTDQITVTATITDGGGLTAADITADLQGLGGGAAVNPDTYAAGVATWVLASVTCTPSDGTVTVTAGATDGLGNVSSGSDTIIADNTPPDVVTGFTAAPGHNKVSLGWDDASGADLYYYGVMVRRAEWDSYPEYDDAAPAYPADETEGDQAFSGDATAAVDDFDADGMDRGIYYYQAFVYDMALNYSAAGTASFDRSTNYWLGDVRPIAGSIGAWTSIGDGSVATADISALGSTYYLPTSDPSWDPHCDVGPTDDYSRVGIPEPDDVVDFEDLMIFSMNYGVVVPLRDGELPEMDPADQPLLVLDCSAPQPDGILTAVLRLADHGASVAGFHARIDFQSSQMQVLSVERSEMLDSPEVFFISVNVDQGLVLDGAALGGTLQGEGELVRVRFLVRSRAAQPKLGATDLRDAHNRPFEQLADELSERESADVGGELALPTHLRLVGASPNPFLGQTRIQFELPEAMGVSIQIFDLNGRLVRTLSDGVMSAGVHEVTWNGRTNSERPAAAGVYFCVLQAGNHNLNQKLLLKR